MERPDSLQVIGAGAGRTGTMSMQAALERLGFGPCFHGRHFFDHPERLPLWRAGAQGSRTVWKSAFAGYAATLDWPSMAFWRELVEAFPEAKVLLTIRDPDEWYDSVHRTIFQMFGPDAQNEQVSKARRMVPGMGEAGAFLNEMLWDRVFSGRFADRDHAIGVYLEHNAAVEREVPPSRLLVIPTGSGWEPLCSFLGVAVPDEPYPHLNEAAGFQQLVENELVTRINSSRMTGDRPLGR